MKTKDKHYFIVSVDGDRTTYKQGIYDTFDEARARIPETCGYSGYGEGNIDEIDSQFHVIRSWGFMHNEQTRFHENNLYKK